MNTQGYSFIDLRGKKSCKIRFLPNTDGASQVKFVIPKGINTHTPSVNGCPFCLVEKRQELVTILRRRN
jgi:hypothetical protein